MGWKPGTGFTGFGQWIGYNEAMILYILALGSPTHPVPTTCWNVWTSGYDWMTYYGYTYVNFPPLFGHQYSHCWIDFRIIQDAYMRSQGHHLLRELAAGHPGAAGLLHRQPVRLGRLRREPLGAHRQRRIRTGYNARGAPPPQNDNGTITPTAPGRLDPLRAGRSRWPCLQNMYNNYRPQLWGPYGFRDAFNLTANWWATDYIGIDQGPIIIMIENYRTGRVWSRFMQNPDIQPGLQRAGFIPVGGRRRGTRSPSPTSAPLFPNAPNPLHGPTAIRYRLAAAGPCFAGALRRQGRQVRRLAEGPCPGRGPQVELDGAGLPAACTATAGVRRQAAQRGSAWW